MAASYSYVMFLIASVWTAAGNSPKISMEHLTAMLLVHIAATTIYVLKHKHDISTFAKPTATILAMSTVVLYVVSPILHNCDVIKVISMFLFAVLTSTVYITAPIVRTVRRLLELQEHALEQRFEYGFRDSRSQTTGRTSTWSRGRTSSPLSTPPRSLSPIAIDPEAVASRTKHAQQVYESVYDPAGDGSEPSFRLSTYSISPRSSIAAYLGQGDSSRGSDIPSGPAPRQREPFYISSSSHWHSEISLLDLSSRYPRRC